MQDVISAWPGQSFSSRFRAWFVLAVLGTSGCGHAIPIAATFRGDTGVTADASIRGSIDVKLPTAADPGEMAATIVRVGKSPGPCSRIALIDVDGLLLNQNYGSLYAVSDNPLAAFRDKLDAAAKDPQVAAILLRINSPGGSVTTCDIMAEELRRFRVETNKPTVACMMDLATAGAYLVASQADQVVAHPTAVTAGLGVIFNHYNLEDAMAQLNITADSVKSGNKIDMGTVTAPLNDASRALIQKMADAYREHLFNLVRAKRTKISPADVKRLEDGRVLLASQAVESHLVDQLGYLHDAISTAERLAGVSGAEVVLFHRTGYPAHSIYAVTPSPAPLSESIPFSYPGLDRSKLPTFLYLWQPDPTVPHITPH
jgi:protease-4